MSISIHKKYNLSIWKKKNYKRFETYIDQSTLVEREAFVLAFSLGSTLEPGLKVFRRRGPKWSL
jgi:hypothetical protein